MRMNKKFFAIMAAVFLMGQAVQAEERNALVVHLKDGTSTTFLLDDEPRATFSDGVLKVVSSSLSMDFPREEVLRFTYVYSDAKGTSMLPAENVKIILEDNQLRILGLDSDTEVFLFSLEGQLLSEIRVGAIDGKVEFPFDAYSSGFYIIKIKGVSYKIVKR